MPPLAETQAALRAAIVAQDSREVLPLLTGGRDPTYRLSIHQRHFEASLVDLLRRRFPALEWLVGEAFLSASALAYARRTPPRRPALGEYGADFPAFLTAQPAAATMPWLAEVGALEWVLAEAAAEIELPPAGIEALAAHDETPLEALRLRLQRGIRYRAFAWPVDDLVRLHLEGNAPETLALAPIDVFVEVRGARGAFSIRRLDAASFTFRCILSEGAALAAALGGAAAQGTIDVGAAVAALFADGLVTAIGTEGSRT